MKKRFPLLLVLIFALALFVACSPAEQPSAGEEPGLGNPAAESTYKVTVVDEENQPVSDATVQFCDGDICMLPLVTDANGVVTMELAAADYSVKVTIDGYTGADAYKFAKGSTELTVQLTKIS